MWEDEGTKREKRKREEVRFHNLPQGIMLPIGEAPAGWLPHHVHSLQISHSRMVGGLGQRTGAMVDSTCQLCGAQRENPMAQWHPHKLRNPEKRESLGENLQVYTY